MFAAAPIVAFCALYAQQTAIQPRPVESRFQLAAPLPSLPSVILDTANDGIGVAQQLARNRMAQARIMWIDGTANLDRMSTEQSVSNWIARIRDIGFNTVVFDVKPIVGYTLYPSKMTTKLTEWRGQKLPMEFDPLAAAVRACRREGLTLFASMNALSEGHRFTGTGPGYSMPDMQTVQYVGVPILSADGFRIRCAEGANPEQVAPSEAACYTTLSRARAAGRNNLVIVDRKGVVVGRTLNDVTQIPSGGAIYTLPDGRATTALRVSIETEAQFVPIATHQTQFPLMMNPHDERVQDRVEAFAREIVGGYDVDGLVFDDRLRYANSMADFSPATRVAFEKYLGAKAPKPLTWPDDVFRWTHDVQLKQGIRPGKWYDAWMAWRAWTLRSLVSRIGRVVHGIPARTTGVRPMFGIYAGSGLGGYEKFGSNWSSTRTGIGFPYFTPTYRKTGFAGEIDFLMPGCYFRVGTIAQAMERGSPTGLTVEAAAQLANRAVRDDCWVYAGIMLSELWDEPEALSPILQAACGASQGVMVFDLSHRFELFEPTLRQAFRQRVSAPHAIPGLLPTVRARRAALDRARVADPPIAHYEFDSTAGF